MKGVRSAKNSVIETKGGEIRVGYNGVVNAAAGGKYEAVAEDNRAVDTARASGKITAAGTEGAAEAMEVILRAESYSFA